MRRFYLRGLLYLTPLIIIIVSIVVVDPYYLFHKSRAYSQSKFDIGYSYDQGRRYKLFTFMNNPVDKVILGASEINLVNERNIPESGWHSLSFGGAQLEESIDLFWKISQEYPLSKVLLAPEFIKFYNAIIEEDINYYNWSTTQACQAMELYNNKLECLLDKYTIQSTWNVLLESFGSVNKRSKPQMSKAAFWTSQLDYGKQQFSKDIDTGKVDAIYSDFRKIKKYCEENGVEVIIVIPIQHEDLIRLEYSDNVFKVYRDYLLNLIKIFDAVYYFDYPSKNSKNKELFSDPFHYIDANLYINSLWGKTHDYLYLDSEDSLHYIDSLSETIRQ